MEIVGAGSVEVALFAGSAAVLEAVVVAAPVPSSSVEVVFVSEREIVEDAAPSSVVVASSARAEGETVAHKASTASPEKKTPQSDFFVAFIIFRISIQQYRPL